MHYTYKNYSVPLLSKSNAERSNKHSLSLAMDVVFFNIVSEKYRATLSYEGGVTAQDTILCHLL